MSVVLRLRKLVDLFISNKCTLLPHNVLDIAYSKCESWWPELCYLEQSEGKWLSWNPPQLLAFGVLKDA